MGMATMGGTETKRTRAGKTVQGWWLSSWRYPADALIYSIPRFRRHRCPGWKLADDRHSATSLAERCGLSVRFGRKEGTEKVSGSEPEVRRRGVGYRRGIIAVAEGHTQQSTVA